MQDGAYYVGRLELLQWINQSLALNINKIEQTASGAIACQLLDQLHPGIVPIQKVDFNCKNEYEYITNWKVLQSAFNKLNIDKEIDINKLVKGRPLDNMEFLQWFKHYYDTQLAISGIQEYDPIGRREQSKSGNLRESGSSKVGVTTAKKAPLKKTSSGQGSGNVQKRPPSAGSGRISNNSGDLRRAESKEQVVDQGEVRRLNDKVNELSDELSEVKKQKLDAEDETNFYYEKLRAVEMVCQEVSQENIPVVGLITRLLYAKEPVEHNEILKQWQASRDSENKPPNQDDFRSAGEFDQQLQM
eukprot:TRINITY_DN6372_c1_g6_i2.p1 TRINITY_DN6372_c1_g6~~TRINITY_DN6372_c1_g6_i2.p1  ORF type:complete len:302 (-),score=35.94 TRINITY_DN6372_c1_g6_i2:200-1105(-)